MYCLTYIIQVLGRGDFITGSDYSMNIYTYSIVMLTWHLVIIIQCMHYQVLQ